MDDAAARLTEREAAIAERAARGQTNVEIACALLVSPKTVEWNLTRVYQQARRPLANRARRPRRQATPGENPTMNIHRMPPGSRAAGTEATPTPDRHEHPAHS
jgi:hypothetical protein